ncbi:hypothetical protein H310_01752 [Aphanomyces invadans]|uniref:Transmembrane protein n=1 Tax=Aphanomyces invadans TaxID=157072 RepID=A0A024ULQ8_9STRA|nr:hypothetical protein H310_01752 [Aphanomyces invadans]ETW07115.1 hypothetical protein H310_01752 [Aphanomyces invadans]|eukprot:XP_008863208.1 hypothetical protein H310_01752 [Aphanomyces invadans]
MRLWSVLSGGGGGYFSVYMVLGIALIAKALQESWLAAFRQHEALVAAGKSRRLAKLRFGFWSLMWNHVSARWLYWVPGLALLLIWLWTRHGPTFWSDTTDDVVDVTDMPPLEPIDLDLPRSSNHAKPSPVPSPKPKKAPSVQSSRPHTTKHRSSEQVHDEASVRRRKKRFEALLAHKAEFETQPRPPKPQGWLVYDPVLGKLVVAATGQPAPDK